MSTPQVENIISQVKSLSHLEKIQLVEEVMAILREEAVTNDQQKPRTSWYGMCADLGPGPAAEVIDEVRRDMWKNFPREDI